MIELTPEQRALTEAMSEVSETAYCAGWLDGTEFEVWRLLNHGGSWGQADAEHLAPLLADVRAAFDRAGCWIVWDDEHEEQPITLGKWRSKYRAWAARHGKEDTSVTDRMMVWLRETLDAAGQLAEAAARETTSADWEYQGHDNRLVATSPPRFTVADVDFFDSAPGRFMAANDPAAVLRRIAADRKTLEDCENAIIGWTYQETKELAQDTIRNLAEGWGWTEETT